MGMAMSIMTTLFCGAVSLMQMYLSDSMVTCVKVINCGLMPTLPNVKASRMAMGAFAAMAGVDPREFESERWCVSGALRDLKQ